MKRVLALDLSLTSTGVASDEGTFTIKTSETGAERLAYIRDEVRKAVFRYVPEVVAIEGYAYARANQAHQIGELGGVVRLLLHDMGIDTLIVPPASIKKWATGKGNADKDTMLEVAIREFAFEGHGNDEADAWLLYLMALDALRPDVA